MDIIKLKENLARVLAILHQYLDINAKYYVTNSSIRSVLVSIHQPLHDLSGKINEVIILNKINNLSSGLDAKEQENLLRTLGIE